MRYESFVCRDFEAENILALRLRQVALLWVMNHCLNRFSKTAIFWLCAVILTIGLGFGRNSYAQNPNSPAKAPAKAVTTAPSPIEVRNSFAALARRLLPSVVGVRASNNNLRSNPKLFQNNEDLAATGSGFIVDNQGHIITNNHVVELGQTFQISLQNGTILSARLVGRDAETDIAVLKVTSPQPLTWVPFANSDAVNIGDWAIAIGSPFGLGNSFSLGVISGRNRDLQSGRFDNFLQTDAAINQGNSGGPLFNDLGQVIGVNTAIVSNQNGGGSLGIGFAVPSNVVRRISSDIIQYGYVRRGWVGFRARPASVNEGTGVVLTAIAANSPAARAGLRAGDRIYQARNLRITDPRQLARLIADTPQQTIVRIDAMRGNRRIFANVTVGLAPSSAASSPTGANPPVNAMGLVLRIPSPQEAARLGPSAKVIVASIDPFGAARGKLQPGDILLEIQGRVLADPAQARAFLAEAVQNRGTVIVKIKRGNDTYYDVLTARN